MEFRRVVMALSVWAQKASKRYWLVIREWMWNVNPGLAVAVHHVYEGTSSRCRRVLTTSVRGGRAGRCRAAGHDLAGRGFRDDAVV